MTLRSSLNRVPLRCRIGWHRWLYYGPFDTGRHCVLCMKRQSLHGDLWTWFDRWI